MDIQIAVNHHTNVVVTLGLDMIAKIQEFINELSDNKKNNKHVRE